MDQTARQRVALNSPDNGAPGFARSVKFEGDKLGHPRLSQQLLKLTCITLKSQRFDVVAKQVHGRNPLAAQESSFLAHKLAAMSPQFQLLHVLSF
jgi:hypothetical protein